MPDASGNGYWVVTQTGNVCTFGDAPYYGAPGAQGVPVTSAVRTLMGGVTGYSSPTAPSPTTATRSSLVARWA
jgi:hypothetical protein